MIYIVLGLDSRPTPEDRRSLEKMLPLAEVASREAVLGALSGVLLGYLWTQYVAPHRRLRQQRARHLDAVRHHGHGKVFLVGAGPGDPELLTVKAQQLLRVASVAVMDDLVSEPLYRLLPRDCEIIYVGKRGGKKDSAKQVDIDAILVQKCQQGHLVVRVKGGDPMIFGRVHSEIQSLCRAKCRFEVVPGISSALAAPAVANIPITHKELSRSFLVISGHKPDDMDFALLAQIDTIVMLMATRTLGHICARLIECGRSPETPVALVHQGTLPDQVTLLGSLQDIAVKASNRSYSPAIVVIGQVAKFADLDVYLQDGDEDTSV